ncbi:MAG TPA: family 20 glycosylhydrolase [Gemmatimonadaceae bacterium]|nr:family 20 glycosylhydrolase [Gemmatimonadaceae bacterium]
MRFRVGLVASFVPVLLLAPRVTEAQADPGKTPPRILSTDRTELRVMPLPIAAELRAGSLDLRRGLTTVGVRCPDARVARALVRFGRQLTQMRPRTPSARGGRAAFSVSCAKRAGSIQQPVEDESYTVVVRPNELSLSAQTPYGVLRGLETILQLVERTDSTISLPAITIDDRPRFPWRGLMIDVARHWMPKQVILRNLDAMAAVKLNVLHLHLSDDQGFRVESRLFPKLHQDGSGGSYYTQSDISEIVAFAGERGIRVVPEFDLPGHTTSWLVAYPELGSAPGPYTLARDYGIYDATMDPTREEVYEFLDRFVGEMARLFPDPFLHIGGDEVSGKTHWNSNPRIQRFMRDHKLEDNHALQAYFNRRLQKILADHGRAAVGWDEILSDSLRGPVVVQAWRSQEKLFEAVHRGFGGILSAGWYLDHKLPAADLYRVEPTRLRDVVEIVPDSARWKSWSIRIQAGAGVVDGRLTLFGPPERTTGALDIAGAVRPITSAMTSGDTMRLAVKSPEGAGTMVAVPRADSLRGTVGLFGFSLPFVGKRIGGSDIPGSTMPTFKTVPPLTEESEKRIVGGEAAMWSEVVSAGTIDSRIWPRTAAVAERLWSAASITDDVDDMYRRLDHVSAYLTTRGVTHESAYPGALRDLLGGNADIAPLRTLVDVLEEVKFYQRMAYNPAQAREPELRSLADVARPESQTARRFAARVETFLSDTARRAEATAIRVQLETWRDNHARLAPLLGSAKQAQDIRVLSERLASAATIGLTALDALERRQPLPAADVARYTRDLSAAAAARAAVINPVIPAIQRLLDRAG